MIFMSKLLNVDILFFKEDFMVLFRKCDYIELVFCFQVESGIFDQCFYYELFLLGYLVKGSFKNFLFLGKIMCVLVWVFSMIGGIDWANIINYNLAWVCKEFGMGMGLGFC